MDLNPSAVACWFFFKENYVLTNGMRYIYIYICIVMNDIVLVVWNVLFEDRACGNDIVVFVWIISFNYFEFFWRSVGILLQPNGL